MLMQSVAGFFNDTWYGAVLKFLLTVGGAILLLVKSVDHVDAGDLALKRRVGKVQPCARGELKGSPKIVHPGLRLLLPFMDNLWKICVRQQQAPLRNMVRELQAGKTFTVSSTVRFQVVDIYRALTVAKEVNDQVVTYCEAVMRDLIQDPLLPYRLIEEWMPYIAQPFADLIGVKIVALHITSANPHDYSILARAWHDAGNASSQIPVPVLLSKPVELGEIFIDTGPIPVAHSVLEKAKGLLNPSHRAA
jgi:hypothetical protein